MQAELEAARRDGTLDKMNSEAGYAPELDDTARALANGRSEGRTRQEVLQELQRAREDGTMQRMNTNRG